MNQPCRIVSISEENDDALSAPGDPDIYDVLDQVDDLFRRVDVRPDGNEKPFEACLGRDGRVLGATVAGLYDASPDEADPLQRPRWSFSVAVDEAHRRKGIARMLVGSLAAAYPRDLVLLEGKVVNPHMVGLLRDMGFVNVDSERDNEEFSDFERRVGRRMHRPNPRRSIDVEGDPEGTRQRLIRVADAKLMEARRRGLLPLATAEDVAHAGLLADLDARSRSLSHPGSRRWHAMEDEIARSASVAETPIEVLRASTAAVSQLYDIDEEMYGRSGRHAGEKALMAFRRAPESSAAARPEPREPKDVLAIDLLHKVLKTLTYREREVIKLRYGIGDGYTYTLEEVAKIFKVTQERVRQIEVKAIQRLRGTSRFDVLSQIVLE